MKFRDSLIGLLAATVFVTTGVTADDAAEPLASFESEDGKIEFIDYVINDDDIAIIMDYTNTTDNIVTPSGRIGVKVLQDGAAAQAGDHFDLEGVKDENTEVPPDAKIRVAEYFQLTNQNPIEVEFSQAAESDGKESPGKKPLNVKIDLNSGNVTASDAEEIENGGMPGVGDMNQIYEDVMNEYEMLFGEDTD